jgi:hypothetical protein
LTTRSHSESRYRPAAVTRPDARARAPSAPSKTVFRTSSPPRACTRPACRDRRCQPGREVGEHGRGRRDAQRQQREHDQVRDGAIEGLDDEFPRRRLLA